MAGKPIFSEGEDSIILATSGLSAEETNERLRAGGYRERSANSIKQRRYFLRRGGGAQGMDADLALAEALKRRSVLTAQQERIAEEIAQVTQTINDLVAKVGAKPTS